MKSIAVLIPCLNEELTIGTVVADFKRELPTAEIYVFDNNSTDRTAEVALKAGAVVQKEARPGKGSVVRSMFRKIEADIYVLVDGDNTYPASDVHRLIQPIVDGAAEMVVGDRLSSRSYHRENKRLFHEFGNGLVLYLINRLFKADLNDIMTGYRAFSHFFVKNCPVMSDGFEIETELTLHALDKKLDISEISIQYKDRPKGSSSKLNTYLDGIRILKTIFRLFKNYKPFIFFSILAAFTAFFGLVVGIPPILEYIEESYVYKVPSAILAAALETVAILLFAVGLTLDTLVTQNKEAYELKLLSYWSKESE